MTTPAYPSLIDEQIAELPESMALPDGRLLMVFKGPTVRSQARGSPSIHREPRGNHQKLVDVR
ncbi:hypothetical protein [Pseudomonas putida]|uniref:hypothetical protein n=1 Tax=Pseudomonas putida TaxID=303 RepID=UPI000DFA3C47|nr:hypothetical protein [Pseudomonas putida]SUF22582.1 Uncharacterised protein [Pseudomonas putida]